MKTLLAAAALVLGTAAPARAADFPDIGDLAQGEFRDIARDLGAAFSYKGVTPATPLGTLGFDVGLEVTQTQMENSRLLALAGSDDYSSLVIPKVHIHKGLPANFDISAFVGGATQVDAYILGGAVRWTLADDGLVYPAVGVRASYTKTTGTGDLKIQTGALDLLVSKKFTVVTPYVGAGVVRTEASVANSFLAKEKIDESRVFGGVNVNLVAMNLAFEAEKMGDNVSLSAKFGWRF
jgi:opacity protein-like surface antigen